MHILEIIINYQIDLAKLAVSHCKDLLASDFNQVRFEPSPIQLG